MPIAARNPPTGGPTNWFIAVSTAKSRLLAWHHPVGAHDRRQHRARGRVEHRLETPEHERDDVHEPDRCDTRCDRHRERGQQDDPSGVDEDHRATSIEPIGQGSREEREHEPR